MAAYITIELTAGTSPRRAYREAVRLSKLLGVGIHFTFNGISVAIIGEEIVYALDQDGVSVGWFIDKALGEER